MNNEDIRKLRAEWSQCMQDGNGLWAERKVDEAEKKFRRAFRLSKQISRAVNKCDLSVEITLKTMTEFYRGHASYVKAALYYAFTKFWYVECWMKFGFRRRNRRR